MILTAIPAGLFFIPFPHLRLIYSPNILPGQVGKKLKEWGEGALYPPLPTHTILKSKRDTELSSI